MRRPQRDASGFVRVTIHTLEGVMEAVPGDWIIRGVKGELYPCKPDIFAATYEPLDGDLGRSGADHPGPGRAGSAPPATRP
jgi:hypothetical protein